MGVDIIGAFGLGEREMICLVGAGGKTTLMFALARHLARSGHRVVTTTTTKIFSPEDQQSPAVILVDEVKDFRPAVHRALAHGGHVTLAARFLAEGKLAGLDPEFLCRLYEDGVVDYLIIEADGAAGRSIKAPAVHEPVIPAKATLAIPLVGLDAVNRPIDDSLVFRLDHFCSVVGKSRGQIITPADVAYLLTSPQGSLKNIPPRSRVIPFLNKSDLPGGPVLARQVVAALAEIRSAAISRLAVGRAAHDQPVSEVFDFDLRIKSSDLAATPKGI
ncbi:MAG: putative selenium-dependent hydroxylase accessory protein YqeC [Deltaproteobacteria bacterium]|nr:putative selenium-dependent hydroxylase accessory protein YqeC [Deltaproteobacteria bacterium]